MIVGVDYGGTIDKYPKRFKLLIKWFNDWGHDIYIVPGRNYKYFSGNDIEQQVKETYYDSLSKFGITRDMYEDVLPHDDRKHTDIDKGKGKQCIQYKIDLFFDDNNGYIEDIERHSPSTKVVKVI